MAHINNYVLQLKGLKMLRENFVCILENEHHLVSEAACKAGATSLGTQGSHGALGGGAAPSVPPRFCFVLLYHFVFLERGHILGPTATIMSLNLGALRCSR